MNMETVHLDGEKMRTIKNKKNKIYNICTCTKKMYIYNNEERYDTGRQHSLCGNYSIYNQIK